MKNKSRWKRKESTNLNIRACVPFIEVLWPSIPSHVDEKHEPYNDSVSDMGRTVVHGKLLQNTKYS